MAFNIFNNKLTIFKWLLPLNLNVPLKMNAFYNRKIKRVMKYIKIDKYCI